MTTFRQFIKEMTMKSGKNGMANFDPLGTIHFLKSNSSAIGHIDRQEVVFAEFEKKYQIYGIRDTINPNSDIVAFLAGHKDSNFGNDYLVTDVIYVDEKHRRQKNMQRLYWFLKHHENLKIIGSHSHTNDAIKFFDSMSNSQRFNMYWLNVKTGEKEVYISGADDSKYRSTFPTDWRILIESDNKESSSTIPRWTDTSSPLATSLSSPFTLFYSPSKSN